MRARKWLWQLFIALDQLLKVLLVDLFYLLHLSRHEPSADETISSFVGRGLLRNDWWAAPAAKVIDAAFTFVGEPPHHCLRSIESMFLDT